MSTVKGLGEKPTTTTGHPMLNTNKFEVIHEYFGHDDRDGLTHEGHYVARTDDAVAAFAAAQQYERKHEVGRYFEDGAVVVRSEGKTWLAGDLHRYLSPRKLGPVHRSPVDYDPTHPDYCPF